MPPREPTSEWSIADAKSRLSEVLNRADEQAQIITRRGRRYVVLDGESYARLTGDSPRLKDVILGGPSLEGVDLARDSSAGRDDVTL
jgi:prevent-host-death family protein